MSWAQWIVRAIDQMTFCKMTFFWVFRSRPFLLFHFLPRLCVCVLDLAAAAVHHCCNHFHFYKPQEQQTWQTSTACTATEMTMIQMMILVKIATWEASILVVEAGESAKHALFYLYTIYILFIYSLQYYNILIQWISSRTLTQ